MLSKNVFEKFFLRFFIFHTHLMENQMTDFFVEKSKFVIVTLKIFP